MVVKIVSLGIGATYFSQINYPNTLEDLSSPSKALKNTISKITFNVRHIAL
jgi:hypothetical protein